MCPRWQTLKSKVPKFPTPRLCRLAGQRSLFRRSRKELASNTRVSSAGTLSTKVRIPGDRHRQRCPTSYLPWQIPRQHLHWLSSNPQRPPGNRKSAASSRIVMQRTQDLADGRTSYKRTKTDIQFGCFQFKAAQTSGENDVKTILRRAPWTDPDVE